MLNKKWFSILVTMCVFLSTLLFPLRVYAASSSVSASARTVYVGDSVTVSVNITGSNMYSVKGNLTSSSSGVLSGSGNIWRKADLYSEPNGFSSYSYSATFVAKSVGSATVTFQPDNGSNCIDMSENLLSLNSSSVTINVIQRQSTPSNNNPNQGNNTTTNNTPSQNNTPNNTQQGNQTNEQPQEKASNEARLSELKLSVGTLNQKFDPDTTNYSVVLEKDVTSLTISAKTKDDKATVTGVGEVKVSPGENTLSVIVTAEDGTTKTYSIKASVDETPDVFVQYNNQKLGVVKNLSNVTIPETFEKVTVNVSGKDVEAYKSNLRNLTIIYMIDDAEEKNWYLYDENTKTITSIYKPFAILGRNLAIIDIPQELQNRAGMKYQEVEIETVKLMGWTFENPEFENYILVYLMDEQGEMKYYLYEKTEDSIMLYSNQAAVTQKDYDKLNDDFNLRMIMILALAATNVLTIILLIIVMLTKKKKNKKRKEKKHKENETLMEETPVSEEVEEVIEPFDSWKYESMPEQNDPYDDSYR